MAFDTILAYILLFVSATLSTNTFTTTFTFFQNFLGALV